MADEEATPIEKAVNRVQNWAHTMFKEATRGRRRNLRNLEALENELKDRFDKIEDEMAHNVHAIENRLDAIEAQHEAERTKP